MTHLRIVNGLCLLALVVGLAASSGCESQPKWRETDEKQSITTGGLDIQNFNNAAAQLTNQMLSAPRVADELAQARAANRNLPLIKLTRIKNDTALKINMVDYLVTPVEETLVNSGKADFFSEDKMGQDLAAAQAMMKKYGAKADLPDFVLHGTVSKLASSDGSTVQNAYVFQLRLTNTLNNRVVFVGSKQIVKQGS